MNIVPTPFVRSVVMVENKPFHCQMLHHGECSCWIGHLYNQNKENQELYHRIQAEMHEAEFNVAQMKEFRNLKEFAAVFQPWPVGLNVSLNFFYSKNFGFDWNFVSKNVENITIILLCIIFESRFELSLELHLDWFLFHFD